MWRRYAVAAALAGCNTIAGIHELPPIDAPPDSSIDAPPVPLGQHYHFVIDHEYVPTNNTEARAYGLDLDGDGMVDNALGMVLGTLVSMGLNVQTTTNTAVDDGVILMLADVQALDLASASNAGFTIYFGANPSPPACMTGGTTCRQHLTGAGHFDVSPTSPRDPEIVGTAAAGSLMFGPGTLDIQAAFIDAAQPLPMTLVGARVKLTGVTGTSIVSGVLAGAITQTDIDTKLLPSLQQSSIPIIARDCCGTAQSPQPVCDPNSVPACGCVAGTDGKTLLGLLDTSPRDCKISLTEIMNNSLIQSLLSPDVTIDGQMALSFGVGITAVGGTFTP
jgi:hypothetical protein